ncbi:MAG: histidine phosphatase family protein [Alphaproteobacteria bacterium]|nr:histidine phosphatase family protein [Alphaproteobacteria bacterium]
MKTLYLLRHCEALSASTSDFERPLSERGTARAEMLGRIMKEKKYAPSIVLCSPALRTRETLKGIMETVKIPVIQYEKGIYEEGREDIFAMIKAIDDRHESALVVGHNPSMHALAMTLADEEASPNPDLVSRIAAGYSPGTMAVLYCPQISWRALRPQENRLTDLLT